MHLLCGVGDFKESTFKVIHFSYGKILQNSDILLINITLFVAAFKCHTGICVETRNPLKGASGNALRADQCRTQICC